MHPALNHFREHDPVLHRLTERVGPYALESPGLSSACHALMRSIVYQQLSGKAAATIHRRFVTRFGDGEQASAEQVAQASEEELRSVGLSRQKSGYIRGLAQAEVDGRMPTPEDLERMDDEGVIETLTRFKGIGRWTVEMLLMFWMERPDILPVDDLGIRKGFQLAFGTEELPDAGELRARGELWRPWRSVASWYLWRATEL